MTRFLFITAVSVLLFFLLLIAVVQPDARFWIGVMCLGAFALAPFPATWQVERAVPFYLLYACAYFFLDHIKRGGIGYFTVWEALALPFIFAALFTLLWKDTFHKSPWTRGLIIVGMVAIGLSTAFFSGAPGGPGKLMWFLREVLHLSEVAATAVNFVFRKSVHIVAYGALALSAYRVAWGQGATPRRSACAAYSWAVPHAVLDEFSQSRVATRSGSPWDVLLDIAGMTAFVLLFGRVKQEPNKE